MAKLADKKMFSSADTPAPLNPAPSTVHAEGKPQSSAVRHALECVEKMRDTALSKNEARSLTTLMAYIAQDQRRHERTVQEILETRFNIVDVSVLPHNKYEDALRFLVNLRLDEFLH